MKIRKLCLAALLAVASTAQADIIDFVDLTESNVDGLGESAWSTLNQSVAGGTVAITATKHGTNAYAYLDWRHAGLGVCGKAGNHNGAPNTNRKGKGSNICNPGSDDNVTTGEALHFVFDQNVVINKIWFNNTHDIDRNIEGPDDYILINGVKHAGPGNGYAPTTSFSGYGSSVSHFLGSFNVTAGEKFTIAFGNQQFYVSGMEVSVPEPGTLGLLALGLIGLGCARRKTC